MHSRLLPMMLLLISACATDVSDSQGASTSQAGSAGGDDVGGGTGETTPPDGGDTNPPVATDTCVDDEDAIGADGQVHLAPGGCALVDDTSKCCLDTTGTKWVCTGGDEFPGVLDVHDYAQFPCPGL